MRLKAALLALTTFATPALAQKMAAQDMGPIDPARMSAIVRELASPPYEGRAPGTPGEVKTLTYLEAQLKALGLDPAGTYGFRQPVPLIRTRISPNPKIVVNLPGGSIVLEQGKSLYINTVRDNDHMMIDRAPLVFVGYGVTAPERDWDDFKGVDLKSKIAVFLVNDPDFDAQPSEPVAGKFGGRRMTYYGRWTYKYDEAARRGAIGALIVHDTPGAGYGWNTVIAPGGENYDIVRAPGDYRIALQGWIEGATAADLFQRAGLDLAQLRVAARRADFQPVPLGATLSTDTAVKVEHVESQNLLARIPGKSHPDETVMFGAHWDAYGIGAPDAQGRTIRAGAVDDAIGVAAVLELARAFKARPQPDRSLVFALWTGEERGLLGSSAYAAHPLFPAAKTVANLTVDVLQTAGPAHDVVLVGSGQSTLEDRLAVAAEAQGRTITPEALPERGLFYRADHFPMARIGIPSLLLMGMGGGADLVKGGRAAGDAWLTDYMKCYHQTCDLWSPDWDLRGAAWDVALLYMVGKGLADSRDWPDWHARSEFKAIRAKSSAERH